MIRALLTWFLFALIVWCLWQLVWTHGYIWAILTTAAGVATWVVIDDDRI